MSSYTNLGYNLGKCVGYLPTQRVESGVYEIAGLDSPLERGTGMWDWNVGLEYCLCDEFLPQIEDHRPIACMGNSS